MASIDLASVQSAHKRIAPYIRRTPLLSFDYLGRLREKQILLKCENLQRTGSFKIRGASNCILENMAQAKKAGVVCASAGNHAQGVASICAQLGIRATIVMPVITPPIKVQNTEAWGANVVLVGEVYDESFEHATRLAQENGYLFIHPFRDPLIMAGQGTAALEMLDDPAFASTEAVLIPVGGGGLISGCASVLKALKPGIKVYGVTARNAPCAWKAFHKGQPVREPVKYTIAEGTATKHTDEIMLGYLKETVDDIFSISEESIAHAIALVAEHGKMVVEGSGALSVAAILENLVKETRVALLLSGGNIDVPVLAHVLHRGLVEQGRLARLVITIVDRPGGLHAITQILAETKANILQVYHQRATLQTGVGEAEVEVDLETRGPKHTDEIIQALSSRNFHVRRA